MEISVPYSGKKMNKNSFQRFVIIWIKNLQQRNI